MAFYQRYREIRNAVVTILGENPRLDPSNENTYIRQLVKGGYVAGPPFPAVYVFCPGASRLRELAIGVNQTEMGVNMTIGIEEVVPAKNMTDAAKAEIDLSDLNAVTAAEDEVLLIADEIITWMLGDASDVGIQRKRLNGLVSNVGIVEFSDVIFNKYLDVGSQSQGHVTGAIGMTVKRRLKDE